MALKMVEVAEGRGRLKPGGTIIECTSGNTGMGLAGRVKSSKEHKCIFTTTDKQSEEIDILKARRRSDRLLTNVRPDDYRALLFHRPPPQRRIPNSFHFQSI